jgi:hypothetical protein
MAKTAWVKGSKASRAIAVRAPIDIQRLVDRLVVELIAWSKSLTVGVYKIGVDVGFPKLLD